MQEGVKNICSEIKSSIYLHINLESQSDHNNLQYYCNCEPKCDYIIPKFYIDNKICFNALCQTNRSKVLAKMARDV